MTKLELRERQGMRVAPQMYAGQHILALSGIALDHYLDRLAQQHAASKAPSSGVRHGYRVSADLIAVKRSYGYVVKVINPFSLDDFIDKSNTSMALDKAMQLRRALEFRNQTLQLVAQVLVDRQAEFMERGAECLRPLGLQEVAHSVGLSVASVSRAMKDKTMKVNEEDIPLKSFLAQGISTPYEEVTAGYIKQQMMDIIAIMGEIKISDRQMAQLLAERDVLIARRTVAKYRLQIYNENNGCIGERKGL